MTTYDSAERREALARSLDHIGDREAVEARLIADRNQATPPVAALSTHSKAPTARKNRAAIGAAIQQTQKGLTR